MPDLEKKFTPVERRAVFGLSAIYGLRMFGLFLVLPVLAVFAEGLPRATPFLIGAVLGAYGLAQAMLQIPFGLLSDKFGRKRIITIGLLIFALGSLIAAFATDIYWVIVGRVLQGSGAIAAAVLALVADLTRENQRAKSMAFIGMSIGFSFMLALVLAPPLVDLFEMSGLFLLTAAMSILAIFALWLYVPNQASRPSRDVKFVAGDFRDLFIHQDLWRLNAGVFVLHFTLTAMFVVIPILLVKQIGFVVGDHWQIYLPVLVLSVLLMMPMVIKSGNKQWTMRIFMISIVILMLAQVVLFISELNNVYSVALCLLVFFVGFNALEAMLPSLITRLAPPAMKGTAVGIYNTFQFTGVFLGGLAGGYLMGHSGEQAVFVVCGLLIVIWAIIVITASGFVLYDTHLIRLSDQAKQMNLNSRYDMLLAVDGVKDVTIIDEENIAYLKVDWSKFKEQQLEQFDFLNKQNTEIN